jgi:hypothetical protein
MTKIHLPPELRWKTIQYRHQLKPAAHIWTFGRFNELFQEPKLTEIVALDSKYYQQGLLDDSSQMVIGDPLPNGAAGNIGKIVYSEWNVGPAPVLATDWYLSSSEKDAQEIYYYLVFMSQLFPDNSWPSNP